MLFSRLSNFSKTSFSVWIIAVIALLFPLADRGVEIGGVPFYSAEIPLLILGGWFFCRVTKEEIKNFVFEQKYVVLGLGLFLLGATLSFIANPITLSGLGMLKSFFFLPAALLVGVYFFIRQKIEREHIVWLWLSGLVMLAWTGLWAASQGWFTYDRRLALSFESPNYLAMLLAPGSIFSVYFFLTAEKKILKIGSIFFLILLGLVVFFTRSYGAWLSVFAALLLFFFLIPLRRKWMISTFFLLTILGTFVLESTNPKLQSLIENNDRSSLSSREMIWKSSAAIIRDNWLLGIGPGRFQVEYLEYQRYFPPYLEWAVPQPHNLYLALLLQTGTIGIIGFLISLWSIFQQALITWKKKNLSREERIQGAMLFSLVAFPLLYGLVDTPYFKNDLAFAFWLSLALLLVWANQSKE